MVGGVADALSADHLADHFVKSSKDQQLCSPDFLDRYSAQFRSFLATKIRYVSHGQGSLTSDEYGSGGDGDCVLLV